MISKAKDLTFKAKDKAKDLFFKMKDQKVSLRTRPRTNITGW